MGVKFGREYEDIVEDLAEVIGRVSEFYQFFEMEEQDWLTLGPDEQSECIKTLADDIFFALGKERTLALGQGRVHYEKSKHIITVDHGNNLVSVVNLI